MCGRLRGEDAAMQDQVDRGDLVGSRRSERRRPLRSAARRHLRLIRPVRLPLDDGAVPG